MKKKSAKPRTFAAAPILPPPSPAPMPERQPLALAGNMETEVQRAVAEVQGAMTVAKRFPRNESEARDRILAMCARPKLAEDATYSYKRGTTIVEGPSIRLAEALAQSWGNLQCGIAELSQSAGASVVQSFCYDLETNTRSVKIFTVPHVRYTREDGIKLLTDPRDIYEVCANQGARRLRACILAIIPGDVVEEALRACNHTLEQQGSQPEQMKALVTAFAAYNVSVDMLVARLGHKLEAAKPAEIVTLRKVYAAMRDGMTNIEAEFGAKTSGKTAPKTAAEAAAAKANKPKTFAEFEALVLKTGPGSDLQAVLDDAGAALSKDEHAKLKSIAEKIHGGGE